MKIAAVHWIDPHSVDEWIEDSEVWEQLDPPTMISIGMVVAENKQSIALALNRDLEEKSCSCVMIIPRKAIRKIRFYGFRDD